MRVEGPRLRRSSEGPRLRRAGVRVLGLGLRGEGPRFRRARWGPG